MPVALAPSANDQINPLGFYTAGIYFVKFLVITFCEALVLVAKWSPKGEPKCYCINTNETGKTNYLACEKNGSDIKSINCAEGKYCIGPSNADKAIPMYDAIARYESHAFCRKGEMKDI